MPDAMLARHAGRRAIGGLYAVTPDMADTGQLLDVVQGAIDAGVRLLQYRNKNADPALRRRQACTLSLLCREHHVAFIVNDDLSLTLECDADGTHVGASDADLRAARQVLGGKRLLGVSAYASIERALLAQCHGADYVAFGSLFESGTKPAASRAPLSIFRDAREAGVILPLVGIGGITLANLPLLISAGADAAAIIGALWGPDDAYDLVVERAQRLGRCFAATSNLDESLEK